MSEHRHRHLQPVHHDATPTPQFEPGALRRSLESDEYHSATTRALAEICGGIEALEQLDDDALMEAPFDITAVPVEDQALVNELLTTIDPFCETFLDDEYTSIVHRLLARAIAHPAHPLRRRAGTKRIAAALVWIALKGNNAIGRRRGWTGETLWYLLGVSDCASLGRGIASGMGATPSIEAIGFDRHPTGGIVLGDSLLLHSEARRWLIEYRETQIEVISHLEAVRDQRRFCVERDGRVELRGRGVTIAGALKGISETGRAIVMLVFGESVRDPDDVMALSVPDTHQLITQLQSALDSPLQDRVG